LSKAVQKRIFLELLEESAHPKLLAQQAGESRLTHAYHALDHYVSHSLLYPLRGRVPQLEPWQPAALKDSRLMRQLWGMVTVGEEHAEPDLVPYLIRLTCRQGGIPGKGSIID
jgi:hypothetical protein